MLQGSHAARTEMEIVAQDGIAGQRLELSISAHVFASDNGAHLRFRKNKRRHERKA